MEIPLGRAFFFDDFWNVMNDNVTLSIKPSCGIFYPFSIPLSSVFLNNYCVLKNENMRIVVFRTKELTRSPLTKIWIQ